MKERGYFISTEVTRFVKSLDRRRTNCGADRQHWIDTEFTRAV